MALNLAVTVGHATVREQVMQKDFRRVARPTEIAAMAKLVEQGMNEGAIGLSSGLEYDVASYSNTDESSRFQLLIIYPCFNAPNDQKMARTKSTSLSFLISRAGCMILV